MSSLSLITRSKPQAPFFPNLHACTQIHASLFIISHTNTPLWQNLFNEIWFINKLNEWLKNEFFDLFMWLLSLYNTVSVHNELLFNHRKGYSIHQERKKQLFKLFDDDDDWWHYKYCALSEKEVKSRVK